MSRTQAQNINYPPGYVSYTKPVWLGPKPGQDMQHPYWAFTIPGEKEPIAADAIPIQYQDMLPQPVLDSMENDGPISTAFKMEPHLIGVRPKYIAPDTAQYSFRYDARALEDFQAIKCHEEIQGYAQASIEPDADSGINQAELERLHLDHRGDRLVFMVISGWALMMWRSEEDFKRGQYGGRQAPRPLGWWDMRQAHDIAVQTGNKEEDKCPHRIAVLTNSGVVYFRVPYAEDVHIWYNGIRGLIRDYQYAFIKSRDTKHHQEKRWPCAIGLANCLERGLPIGERAMAIAFHCYDMDYNCILGVGEIMIMIEEIEAGIRHNEGRAEAKDRQSAMESALSEFTGGLDDVFERAMTFRNACDKDGNGKVRKDEFIINGQRLMAEAMGFGQSGGHLGNPGDACSVM